MTLETQASTYLVSINRAIDHSSMPVTIKRKVKAITERKDGQHETEAACYVNVTGLTIGRLAMQ